MDRRPDESKSKSSTGALDFAFLAEQTFDDPGLEREVLRLFKVQAWRIISELADLTPQAQVDGVHLLKGSARAIGAWDAAGMADRYEAAHVDARPAILPALIETFTATLEAIEAHLVCDPSP